jgi:aconitate decarboxylase
MAATSSEETRTDRLVKWAVDLKYSDIPDDVVQRTKDFFLDTLGCAIAGRSHPAVSAMVRFAAQMGPTSGKSELIDSSQNLTTSPAFASLINAAASHVVEQDDLHNRSIMHPVSGATTLMISPRIDMITGHCHFPCSSCSSPRYRI